MRVSEEVDFLTKTLIQLKRKLACLCTLLKWKTRPELITENKSTNLEEYIK